MLFKKDKELLLKLTNAILLLWLIGAIVALLSSIVDISIKDPVANLTYEEYKGIYCYSDESSTEEQNELRCKGDYKLQTINNDNYKIKVIYNSAIMIVVVGSTLYLLNRKKQK